MKLKITTSLGFTAEEAKLCTENMIEGDTSSKKLIIFSHGFGVKRDARGMFVEIGDILKSEYLVVRFDYNKINTKDNSTTVTSLHTQAEILNKIINHFKKKFKPKEINLICHSMGNIVAGLAESRNISKTILLAPPIENPYKRLNNRFAKRKGTKINEKGLSKIKRSDGSTTYVEKDFWKDLKTIDPKKLYINLAKHSNVFMIRAADDEVIGKEDLGEVAKIDNIKYYEIDGGHDFEGTGRKKLLSLVQRCVLPKSPKIC